MQLNELGRTWEWPDEDKVCRRFTFRQSKDLERVYPRCRGFGLAVQAGGNMGQWPWLLSKKFAKVVTFEPDPICWPYLQQNIGDVESITAIHAALGEREASGAMKYPEDRLGVNLGAQFVARGRGGVKIVTLDSLALPACDLLYLDIEGAELLALRGAADTITRFRPVIGLEEKKHARRYGFAASAAADYLKGVHNYQEVDRYGRDVLLAPA